MKTRLPMILVFVIAFLLLLINTHQNFLQTEVKKQRQAPKLTYSWQIFDSSTWQIDKQQHNDHQNFLTAKAIHYQNQSKISQFTNPFSIQQQPGLLTFIRSENGNSQNDAILNLHGHVQIDRLSLKDNQNKTLKTEQITYNSETGLLVSHVFTELTTPDTKISGIGFSAKLKQGQYKFKSHVKTLYQPN